MDKDQGGTIECGKCNNTGNCPHCNGKGQLSSKQVCKHCQGSGACQRCHGRGWIFIPAIEQLN